MSSPENPRVDVVQERLEQALPLLSWVGCPSISDLDLCDLYQGNCRRCWLEYLKGWIDMGPEGETREVCHGAYSLTDGCRPIASYPTLDIPTYASFVDEWAGPPDFRAVFDFPSGLQIAIPVPRLPRSRRRFVKLLMGQGVPRNRANAAADLVCLWQGQVSYAEMTWNFLIAPWLCPGCKGPFDYGLQPVGMVPDGDTGEVGEQ